MKIKCIESNKYFTKGAIYEAKKPFDFWPWMIMAWDDNGIGRYVHFDIGKMFEIIDKANLTQPKSDL